MEILKTKTVIGNYTFNFVNELSYESSWEEQTSKGVIKFPSKLKLDRGNLKTELKKGTPVSISAGYESEFNEVFTGYVTRVIPSVPIEIMFEDEMYMLKQIEVNTTAKNEKLKDFLARVIPGYEMDVFDMDLPKFIAHKITAAQLLDQFKEDYGFPAFFRGKKLIVGKQYDPQNAKTHIIELNFNVLQDQLEYMAKDDLKLTITGISNMADGSKHEVEIGNKDGESRTLNFFDVSKANLKAVVEKEAERLLYDGYRGSLTIFGSPHVRNGDIIELRNKEESDKTGRYWVDAVQFDHGVNGTRQTIKLGARYDN